MPYQMLADAVLLVHFGIVVFVVLGLPAIIIGNKIGWPWVSNLSWRLTHLAAIGIVVVQAWLGQYCTLTELESWLRQEAGQSGYHKSFIEHWVQRALYYEVPMWIFTVAYTLFALLVAWAWWRFPPRVGHGKKVTPNE